MLGFTSTFTLPTFILPSYSFARDSITGPIARHGPHHSAQKSTTVNLSEPKTSFWKLPSVNSFAIVLFRFLILVEEDKNTTKTSNAKLCHNIITHMS